MKTPLQSCISAMTIFLIALLPHSLSAQGCLPLGITITSQSEIDNFATDYPNCNYVFKDVIIEESATGNITNLNGLSVLDSINGSLIIQNNSSLNDLTGLTQLEAIGGSFKLINNGSLSSISAMSNLSGSFATLEVSNNPELVNLSGIQGVTVIRENLTIMNNAKFSSFAGFTGLTTVGIDFMIKNCDALPHFGGISNLDSIGGKLTIVDNATLTSLAAMVKLSSGILDLNISNNPSLTSIGGLSKIKKVDGDISIVNNSALTSLSGLEDIKAMPIDMLTIKDNGMLSMCAVKSLCNHLKFNGASDISNNATKCNTKAEMQAECAKLSLVENYTSSARLKAFPNPTNGIFTIDGVELENGEVRIFNLTGSTVQHIYLNESSVIDISSLANGVYFFELTDNDEFLGIGKLLKE